MDTAPSFAPWAWAPACAGTTPTASTAREPEYQAYNQTDQNAGDDREIEREIVAADRDVAGEVAEAKLAEQWPGQADGEDHQSEDDEKAGNVHLGSLWVPSARSASQVRMTPRSTRLSRVSDVVHPPAVDRQRL